MLVRGEDRRTQGVKFMTVGKKPDESVEEPSFRIPLSDSDRELLDERAPQFGDLLELIEDVQDRSKHHRSLGARETLAALKALEVAGRLIESLSTDVLAHYQRIGDSAAHGYRTTMGLLQGEFRITPKEARRRTHLSGLLAGRISDVGEALDPLRPVIAEHFADGRISADEAKTLCEAVDDLPPTIRSMHADRVEKTLVELAPTVQLKDVPKLSQRIIQHMDPDGKLPQYETNPLAYTVTLSQQRNGDWRLRGLLDCATGTTLQSLLYGRMKDGDNGGAGNAGNAGGVPIAIRPHRACNAEPQPTTEAGYARDSDETIDTPNSADVKSQDIADASAVRDATEARTVPTGPETPIVPGGVHEPDDAHEYSVTSASDDTDSAIPQIPREAMWTDTHISIHADATIEVNGRTGTFLEDEPTFYLNEEGWPAYLSAGAREAVPPLLQQARSSDTGVAHTVIWEKILGRKPTSAQNLDPADRPSPDGTSTSGCASRSSSSIEEPESTDSYTGNGVLADGSRSPRWLDEEGRRLPGLARHDRLAFLLRSVARERVLHGADHALVVTARPDDLVRPNSVLSTHKGGPLSVNQLETWSNAAQMFVHVAGGAGRTIEIRSQGRFATRSQIAVLAARDQGCTFPDCDAPAEWCEAHHIIAYSLGGETAVDNLTLVCPFHHRWFERSGWESRFLRGLPAWIPPKSVDPRQQPLFHSRFRVALMDMPPELPLTG